LQNFLAIRLELIRIERKRLDHNVGKVFAFPTVLGYTEQILPRKKKPLKTCSVIMKEGRVKIKIKI